MRRVLAALAAACLAGVGAGLIALGRLCRRHPAPDPTLDIYDTPAYE